MAFTAGLDAGSVSVKLAVLDENGRLVKHVYRRHKGHALTKALEVLKDAAGEYPQLNLVFTGSSGKNIALAVDGPHINELSALALATHTLHPGVPVIFEMGGEDSKLIILDNDRIRDFSLNSVCAAGTGSFLDQQAERLNLTIEEFSELALKSERPPRIAGRCSVFAKSDMIHLQQIATPDYDIVAGLCFAVARNFRGSIVRGRTLPGTAAFMGGVSMNKGMVRAFSEVFGMPDLVVPEHRTMMSAIGAALKAVREGTHAPVDLARFEREVRKEESVEAGHKPLIMPGDEFNERHIEPGEGDIHVPDVSSGEKIPAYMGIDVGSISTCLAVTDENNRLLAKRYLRTAGRPIEAVRRGLREIGGEVGRIVDIKGVGTTGSGRYMVADFVGADIVKNEITAQATAAVEIDPKVDTVFEIGGQDSKYISLKDGVIVDFEMNKACAAGTGSFLEEQAEKLGVAIKDEFQNIALSADKPCRLGERCTVFMENSLMANMQRGADLDDLLAGLSYSIVENYINRVVAGRHIGKNIFFQGGTAYNKAVCAAFEKHLDLRITVPPHHDNTGAIGMAMIAKANAEEKGLKKSTFRGFDLADRKYTLSTFECKGCENRCEINKVKIEGEKQVLFYGGRCERYDIKKKEITVPDLFGFREKALWAEHKARQEALEQAGRKPGRGKIGIPYIFFFQDYLPYWTTLLWELGFEPVVSGKTNRKIVNLGVETVLADTCFPIKAALGHVRHLLESGVNTLFIPSFIDMAKPESPYPWGLACPLTQSFPYQTRTAFPEARVVAPIIKLKQGEKEFFKNLLAGLSDLGIKGSQLKKATDAARAAQDRFDKAVRDKGEEVLSNLTERAAVIIGRPYNAFDMGVNLEIPKKLATLDVLSIPMDFLPPVEVYDRWPEMYWRSGQRLLSAARFVKEHPKLYGVCLGSFSCGPDSFIYKYMEKEMGGKPYLHMEIDEHSADAGAITRLEAFLDSVDAQIASGKAKAKHEYTLRKPTYKPQQRVIYVPSMCDHAHALEAAFRYCGVDATTMPEATYKDIDMARKYVSGKECYPLAVTTGMMLARISAPDFDRDRTAFFMPTGMGPCRFGQYNIAHRLTLDAAGYGDVPIYSPNQSETLYREVGIVGSDFSRKCWEGVVSIDLLTKLLHETRPYEKEPGLTDHVYAESLARVKNALLSSNGSLPDLLAAIRRDFENIPRVREKKPLIGIVGEIFVRSNRFSNEDLVRKVEELGGEAWLAPVEEWISYVNYLSHLDVWKRRELKGILHIELTRFIQKRITRKLEKPFYGMLKTAHEPPTGEVVEAASPYLDVSFRGEAILSVGKAVEMVEQGVAGIINAMPFGCMPGTVVTAIMRGVSREHDVPCISIPYDGTDSSANRLQLEAFMEQAKDRS